MRSGVWGDTHEGVGTWRLWVGALSRHLGTGTGARFGARRGPAAAKRLAARLSARTKLGNLVLLTADQPAPLSRRPSYRLLSGRQSWNRHRHVADAGSDTHLGHSRAAPDSRPGLGA